MVRHFAQRVARAQDEGGGIENTSFAAVADDRATYARLLQSLQHGVHQWEHCGDAQATQVCLRGRLEIREGRAEAAEIALDIGVLSDTTLGMGKDSNGAGSTTLMKEIVSGNIVVMPKHLKFVYVYDSGLGEMSKSCLSAVEYPREMALGIGVTNASGDILLSVGFEVRGAVRTVAVQAGKSCQVWSTCACRHSGLLRDRGHTPLAPRGDASQLEKQRTFTETHRLAVRPRVKARCCPSFKVELPGRGAAYHFWGVLRSGVFACSCWRAFVPLWSTRVLRPLSEKLKSWGKMAKNGRTESNVSRKAKTWIPSPFVPKRLCRFLQRPPLTLATTPIFAQLPKGSLAR